MSRISDEEFEKGWSCTIVMSHGDGATLKNVFPDEYIEAKRAREEEKHFRCETIIFDEEVQELKKENADQEQIIQSWKHSCRIERELVESKNGTIERLRTENTKLRYEIEQCKKVTHPGR